MSDPEHPPAATPPAAPKIDIEAIDAAALEEAGVKAKAFRRAAKEADDAKLSEHERTKKALDETIDARSKAEAKADKHAAEAKDLREQIELRDKLDLQGVLPKERLVVDVLLREARKAEGFDEAKWFETQRTERSYLFAGAPGPTAAAAPKLGNTSGGPPPPPAGGSFGAGNTNPGSSVDMLSMTPAQRAVYRRNGFSGPVN